MASAILSSSSALTATPKCFAWYLAISRLASSSGGPMWIGRNRLGRSSASSIRSSRFVVPMISTGVSGRKPSSSVSSCATMALPALDPPSSRPVRCAAIESNSSNTTTLGALRRASANSSLIFRSLSPTYLSVTSGPDTTMMVAASWLATALANSVFPVPGGPWKMNPAGTRSVRRSSGSPAAPSMISIAAWSSSLTAWYPPIAPQDTFGTSNELDVLTLKVCSSAISLPKAGRVCGVTSGPSAGGLCWLAANCSPCRNRMAFRPATCL